MSITIHDVAKRANVSSATAARVLGNYGSVSVKTRERVLMAAEELGYVPNALARSMVKLRTSMVGLVLPDIRNAFFSALAQSAEKAARTAHYRVLVCDTGANFAAEESYLQDLYERRVDGIILASSIPRRRPHAGLQRAPVPVVLVDRQVEGVSLDCVRTDHEDGAYRAVKHLIGLGHRRIGIVLGTGGESVHFERLGGYQRALAEAGIANDGSLVKRRDWEVGQGVVEEFLAMREPPTALFTTNNVITTGVLTDLRRLRRRVPDEVAVVGFDDLDLGEALESPLTAVVQNAAMIGSTAMALLLQRMTEAESPPQEMVLRPSLVVRSSCGSALRRPDHHISERVQREA